MRADNLASCSSRLCRLTCIFLHRRRPSLSSANSRFLALDRYYNPTMSTCVSTPVSLAGLFVARDRRVWLSKPCAFVTKPEEMAVLKRSLKKSGSSRNFSVSAEYKSSGGSGFAAGFLLGGAVFGTLAYVFAPQIRRTLLNEDEYGFRKAKRPIYYDGGLERTRETLNGKINQLNAAIDIVSSKLRGGKQFPPAPVEIDSEVETTL